MRCINFIWFFAYFGPETVMPVTSILATVAAVVLMFGKSLFRLVAYWVRRASFRGRHGQATNRASFWAWPAPPTQHE